MNYIDSQIKNEQKSHHVLKLLNVSVLGIFPKVNLSQIIFYPKQQNFMGQDICNSVSICNNPMDFCNDEQKIPQITSQRKSHEEENHENLTYQPNKQVQPSPQNKQEQQPQTDDFDLFALISQKLGSLQAPKQIILSIDQAWISQPKLFNEGEGFKNYYQQIKDGYDKGLSVFERNGKENAKIQILFQQHIPFTGIFYFKIYLLEYQPEKGLSFVIGIADYLQAIEKKHSKDSGFQQSFMLKILPQVSITPTSQSGEKIKKIIQFTVDCMIDRTSNRMILRLPEEVNQQSFDKMKIYGHENQELKIEKGKLEVSLEIKKNLLDSAVSLSPYIQTQYTGLVLGWDKYQSIKSVNYKLSTIIEEGSSIISTI